MKKVKMGALFMNGKVAKNPVMPTLDGDLPTYRLGTRLEILDCPKDHPESYITWLSIDDMFQWSKTGTLLIADRVLVRGIPEYSMGLCFQEKQIVLDGNPYRLHLLPVGGPSGYRYCVHQNAWDAILDRIGEADELIHWKDMSFWGVFRNGKKLICRGGKNPRDWRTGIATSKCGFRPALEPLTLNTDLLNDFGKCLCKQLKVQPGETFRIGKRTYSILGDNLLHERQGKAWIEVPTQELFQLLNGPTSIERQKQDFPVCIH